MKFLKKFWARLTGGDRSINLNTIDSGGQTFFPPTQDDRPRH